MTRRVRWYGDRILRRGLAGFAGIAAAFLAVRLAVGPRLLEQFLSEPCRAECYNKLEPHVYVDRLLGLDLTLPLYAQFLDYAAGISVAFLPAAALAVAGLAVFALGDRVAR